MTPKATGVRTAIYARVSTSNHGQDINLQVEELRAVARQRGWTIVEEFTDEGISGSARERPGLDAMMQAARCGKINLVCVWFGATTIPARWTTRSCQQAHAGSCEGFARGRRSDLAAGRSGSTISAYRRARRASSRRLQTQAAS